MGTDPVGAAVVRVSDPAEVLSYVPHAIGYVPTQSIVAISLRPPRRRIGLVARVDLDDIVGERGHDVADDLADFLTADGAVALFVVVYTNEPVARARRSRSLADRAFESLMCAQGLPESVETWIVAPDGYVAWGCQDLTCCPTGGRDLRDLDDTRLATQLILAGSAPLASRSALESGIDDDPVRRREFESAVRRIDRVRAQAQGRGDLDRWRVRRTRSALSLLVGIGSGLRTLDDFPYEDDRPLTPAQLGAISAALTDVVVRDLALVAIARSCGRPHGERSTSRSRASSRRTAQVTTASLDSLPFDVGAVFGAGGPAPEPQLLSRVQRGLGDAVRLGRGPMRADLLVILAWLAWWAGDGARAGVHLGEALDLVPDHRLGALIRDSLRHAVPPGWARAAS